MDKIILFILLLFFITACSNVDDKYITLEVQEIYYSTSEDGKIDCIYDEQGQEVCLNEKIK